VHQIARRNSRRYELKSTHNQFGFRTQVQTLGSTSSYAVAYDYHTQDESYRPKSVGDLAGGATQLWRDEERNFAVLALPTADTLYGNRTSLRYSDALLDDRLGVLLSWDSLQRVIQRESVGQDSLRAFGYNALGRLAVHADSSITYEERCEPDLDGRLVCHTERYTQLLADSTYGYDAVGNPTNPGAVVEPGNRLTGFNGYTMTYDEEGNLKSKSGKGLTQTFEWNALGELASVTTNGVTTTYGYDASGRRVRKSGPSGTTRYVYDGAQIALELNEAGDVVAEYSYYPGVDHPHTVRRGGQVYYYLSDGPGHIVGLLDSAGTLVNEYRYTPFGEPEGVREVRPATAYAPFGSAPPPPQCSDCQATYDAPPYSPRARSRTAGGSGPCLPAPAHGRVLPGRPAGSRPAASCVRSFGRLVQPDQGVPHPDAQGPGIAARPPQQTIIRSQEHVRARPLGAGEMECIVGVETHRLQL
jgi:YD repeat-containing protein